MDFGGFVVQGSRPPSAQSSHRPSSARSKHGYHTVSYQSAVDETLFSTHHPTKMHEPMMDFKAPWEYPKPKPLGRTFAEPKAKSQKDIEKKKPKGRPLLWAPIPGTAVHNFKTRSSKNSTSQPNMNDSSQFWNSRDQFRHLKHTPTFVDESLFGSRLEEPSFVAPWNEKAKGEKKRIYLWDHFGSGGGGGTHQTQNGHEPGSHYSRRPKTALGISRDKTAGSKAVPVWKP